MNVVQAIEYGAKVSLKKNDSKRAFKIAAVGIRYDNRIVHAVNVSHNNKYREPDSHAEIRLLSKLGYNAPLVYVIRVGKIDGMFRIAKPCIHCETSLRNHGVKKVIYTTGPNTWESMIF